VSNEALSTILTPAEAPHVHADHSLNMALDRMGTSQLDVLPVVNRANVHQLEGIVTLQDILTLYGVTQQEILVPDATTVAPSESVENSKQQ